MKNVDFDLYKVFYIVAECGSFNKAAEILSKTQPAITHDIKNLEEQLNVVLFTRTPKGNILTKEGKAVYYYAEQLFKFVEANENLLKNIHKENRRCLKIGIPTHIGITYLVSHLEKFSNNFKDIKIEIINKKSDEIYRMLEIRELDLVIDIGLNESKDIVSKKLIEVESCFVGNEKFKSLSTQKNVTLDQLSSCPIILPSKETSNRKMIDLFFEKQKISIEPFIETNSAMFTKELVLNGFGVGWIFKEFVSKELKNKELYEINVNLEKLVTTLQVYYHQKFLKEETELFLKYLEK